MPIDHELRATEAAGLQFDRETHRYYVDGARIPSVTRRSRSLA